MVLSPAGIQGVLSYYKCPTVVFCLNSNCTGLTELHKTHFYLYKVLCSNSYCISVPE